MPESRRVALFHSNWAVQSQTTNAITLLAEAGYAVELFIYTYNRRRLLSYVDLEALQKRTNVQVHHLWTVDEPTTAASVPPPAPPQGIKAFLRTRFPGAYDRVKHAYYAYTLRRTLAEPLLTPGLIERTLPLLADKSYRCLIGVEKEGLIWAGILAQRLQVPLFYYSLELYLDDDHYWRIVSGDRFSFWRLRFGERLHHRRAAATIIQDPDRAAVLFQDNRLDPAKATILYVPVAVLGEAYPQRSRYLQETLGIPDGQKIILYFGNLWERRYVLELAQAAQRFPDDWTLVMHGEGPPATLEKIRALDQRHKVVLSLQMVPVERIQEVIASADVGLLFYSGETQNERLTAFASEKLALYMQCGVPFVAFAYPGFVRLANEAHCGAVVQRLEELPEAVGTLLRTPEAFRQAAFAAFHKYYRYASGFARVLAALEKR